MSDTSSTQNPVVVEKLRLIFKFMSPDELREVKRMIDEELYDKERGGSKS